MITFPTIQERMNNMAEDLHLDIIDDIVEVKKEDAIPLPIQDEEEQPANDFLLSFIVPILNTKENGMQEYLARLFTSIKSNTDLFGQDKLASKLQIIVVDDYSPVPVTLDGIDLAGLNVTLLRNEERRGIGGSRNAGLKEASGLYVWYFDADDLVSNLGLSLMIKHIQEFVAKKNLPDVLFTKFGSLTSGQNNQVVKTVNEMELPDYSFSPVSSCCKVIKREICPLHPEKVYMEDVLFNFMLLDRIEMWTILRDCEYWTYDLRRPSNFTTTSGWLQNNRLTIQQHLVNQPLKQLKLKETAISDLFRLVADLMDFIPNIKHENVKRAAIDRLVHITDKIKCCNYSH